jgi:hypothetical protein
MSKARENKAIREARYRLAEQFGCIKVRSKPMLRITTRRQYSDGKPIVLLTWFVWSETEVFDLLCVSDLGATLRWLIRNGVPRPTAWIAHQCPAGKVANRSGVLESDCTIETAPGCVEAVAEACQHIADTATHPADRGQGGGYRAD